MDNNATDSVDAMAYATAYTMVERSREFHMNAPRTAASVTLTVGCTTSTFDVQRNYDGWLISDVLADMAQMLRMKESEGSSHNSKAVTGDAPRTPSQGPTRDDLVKMAQELAAKYPKPFFYAGVKPPLDLISKMDAAAFGAGLPYVHWDKALVAPACEHCGGQPQKWDSDARCMVSGGECERCGAGKDGV